MVLANPVPGSRAEHLCVLFSVLIVVDVPVITTAAISGAAGSMVLWCCAPIATGVLGLLGLGVWMHRQPDAA